MSDQIQVVDRVFELLEYLAHSPEAQGPTEIAQAVGLPKSTVHRLLSSLHQRGYVEKNELNGTYHIGVKLVEMVSSHISHLELNTEARPYLNNLHDELGLAVYLGTLDGREVVYVEKINISRDLRNYTQIGLRVPAHCSSLGKCLLACMSGDELDFYLRQFKFERYTKNTITSAAEFKRHLREIRGRGWAIDDEEHILGQRCIAAPIFDYRGENIAAVCASGPVALLSDERFESVARQVMRTAAQISRRLCYPG